MTTQTALTLNKAAEHSGKAKKTILTDLASGKLSGHKDDKNVWQIEPSELDRVYPKPSEKPRIETGKSPQGKNQETAIENIYLQHKVELLSELSKRDQKEIEELKNRLEESEKYAKQLAIAPPKNDGEIKLLRERIEELKTEKQKLLEETTQKPRKGFLRRFIG